MVEGEDRVQDVDHRLVVVSNRLPIRLSSEEGALRIQPGAGGLVTALTPVLRGRGGLWVGWSGRPQRRGESCQSLLDEAATELGFSLVGVPLDAEEVELYYEGFSNSILWPLFHDRVGETNFDSRFWDAYLRVVQRFARTLLSQTQPTDLLWVHDYHLFHVGAEVRQARPDQRIGFFLHIPFPPPDILLRLPWCEELLQGLFAYDQVGLQTRRDLRNLQGSLTRLSGITIEAKGPDALLVRSGAEETRFEVQPIGIDAARWSQQAQDPGVTLRSHELRADLQGAQMVLGVDRLDYTKGLLERLDAWEALLERHPEWCGRVVLVQVVVPSREGVANYQELKAALEQRVGAITGRFGGAGGSPIRYLYRSLPPSELVALYRAADVCLVTSLKDGMNLVAKEYVACQVSRPGVLVLSQFAGAASQLEPGALLINPHDTHQTAQVLADALALPEADRAHRMRLLQAEVHAHDVHRWVRRSLQSLARARPLVQVAG